MVFVLYYSGHADGRGLNLGEAHLPFDALRARIDALPATLKVVVLDACQSGAFSRLKGSEGFHYDALAQLQTEGTAVLASSRGSEFSQESDAYQASYFTHHLLAALGGAADRNLDGRVSLLEAYDYTQERTLAATAQSIGGAQHVTLEAELAGSRDATLTLIDDHVGGVRLAAPTSGRFLFTRRDNHAVVAEVVKAKGTPMRLALRPGPYSVLQQHGHRRRVAQVAVEAQSQVELGSGDFRSTVAVGGLSKGPTHRARSGKLRLEVSLGHTFGNRGAYEDRLEAFDLERKSRGPVGLTAAFYYQPFPWLSGGVELSTLDGGNYRRGETENGIVPSFSWRGQAAMLKLRPQLWLRRDVLGTFIEGGIGPGYAQSRFAEADRRHDVGWVRQLGYGLRLNPVAEAGFVLTFQRTWAPLIANELGETAELGGYRIALGVNFAP